MAFGEYGLCFSLVEELGWKREGAGWFENESGGERWSGLGSQGREGRAWECVTVLVHRMGADW